MAHFIEINTGQYLRADMIAAIQFRRESGALMAAVITTIPGPTGTVHYDVRDTKAVAELEMLIVDPPRPRPRGVEP